MAGSRGGAGPLEEGRHLPDALVLFVGLGLFLRLSLTLGLGFALRLSLALGLGLALRRPLFMLRLSSRLFRTDVAVLLLRLIVWLILSIRPVYFIRARFVGVIRRIHVPIFRPVTIHVVRGIYVPVFGRSHIPVFRTIRVPILGAAHGAIVRPIEIPVVGAVLVRIIGAGRRLVGARVAGRHRSGLEIAGFCGGSDRRAAVILRGTQRAIAAGGLLLLRLPAGSPEMAFMFRG